MRGTIALLAGSIAFAVIALLAALGTESGSRTPNLLALSTPPVPRPTMAPQPTPPPFPTPPGPPFVLPQVPTPEPGREGPESTLVEVATGRSLKLWQPGKRIFRAAFSPDGDWLVFDQSQDETKSSLYRVDLRASQLKATLYSDGYAPDFSSRGDLSFLTTRLDTLMNATEDLRLVSPSGVLSTLTPDMYGLGVWSPDGRFLAYVAPAGQPAIGEPIALMLYDSQSGATRKLAEGDPVQGDYRLQPEWSPTSRYLTLAFGGPTGLHRRAFSTAPRAFSVEVPDRAVWSTTDDVLYGYDGTADPPGLVAFSMATQSSSRIDADIEPYDEPEPSPDGKLLALHLTANPDGRRFGGTAVYSLTEQRTLYEVEGGLRRWSADSKHFLQQSGAPGCFPGYSIRAASDGHEEGCLAQTMGAQFSPSGRYIAYVKPQDYRNDPRFWLVAHNDLYVRDLSTGAERKILTDARGPLACLVWSPNEQWLVLKALCDGG